MEGERLIQEARAKGMELVDIVVARSYLQEGTTALLHEDIDELVVLDDQLFKQLSMTTTPSGILATARLFRHDLDSALNQGSLLLVVADAVQDPGNLGTLIRSALAFEATAVLLTKGTVDPFSPKVVRSAMGALFALPVIGELKCELLVESLKERNIEIIALDSHAPTDLWDVDFPEKTALILGNEGQGLSEPFLTAATRVVRIPISSKSESLNVSQAAGIVLAYASHKRGLQS